MRVHLFGASGTGCTTLGAYLSNTLSVPHFDSDAFYWEKTDPPFTTPLDKRVRDAALLKALQSNSDWVLTGSVVSWDVDIAPLLSLAIYVQLPPEERISRLQTREIARYGHRIEEGGDLFESSQAFLEWARGYDTSDAKRSLAGHTEWLASLPCPKLEFINEGTFEQSSRRLMREVGTALGLHGIRAQRLETTKSG